MTVAAIAGCIAAALSVAVGIPVHEVTHVDVAISREAIAAVHHHPAVLTLSRALTQFGNPLVINLVCAAAVGLALWRRQVSTALAVALARVTSAGAETVMKVAFDRPRPQPIMPVAHAAGPSFPSGHSTGIATVSTLAIIGLLLVVRTSSALASVARYTLIAMFTVITAAVATSRVMLGVHYPTDVVAGIGVGSCLACLSVALVARLT